MNLHYGIIGLGPIGTVIATHLRAGGHRVSVLCANRHKFKALTENAVTVTGALETQARFQDIFLDLKDLIAARPDVVLIVTKNSDSPELLRNMKAQGLAPSTILVSCQNGLDVESQIIDEFGSSRALRMVLNLGANFAHHNEVKVNFCHTNILSLRPGVDPAITKRIAEDLTRSGYPIELREDYRVEVFKKVILNSSVGSVCALTGLTMKAVMNEPELFRMVKQIVREGILLAQKEGLAVADSFLDQAIDYLSKGGDHKPSILLDLEAGRKTENDYHCGKLFEYAQRHAIEVPVTQTLYYLIRNKEQAMMHGHFAHSQAHSHGHASSYGYGHGHGTGPGRGHR